MPHGLSRRGVDRDGGAALRGRRGLKLWRAARVRPARSGGSASCRIRRSSPGTSCTRSSGKVLLYWGMLAANHAITRVTRAAASANCTKRGSRRGWSRRRLESLQRQLHPHFVFNTLNAIANLLHRDPIARRDDAGPARRSAARRVPQPRAAGGAARAARCELTAALPRHPAHALRRHGCVRDRRARGATARHSVPVLVLQPLVENAVKHGFAGRGGGDDPRLCAPGRRSPGADGRRQRPRGAAGRARRCQEGVGLSNTRARLEHLYPGRNHCASARPLPAASSSRSACHGR